MTAFWKTDDEKRLGGIAGVLRVAADAADNIKDRGPCPLSTAELIEVADLAKAAAVVCGKIDER